MSPGDRNLAPRPAPDDAQDPAFLDGTEGAPRDETAPDGAASDAGLARAEPPLIIDLDGTLTRVDTLHESAVGLLACGLPEFIGVARAAPGGKAAVKAAVADRVELDVTCLPYREEVLELIRAARAAGREVHLVTAADQRIADAVAAHIGLFDSAHGSRVGLNLGGEAKARFLVERFGERGFDYAGDQAADLPVWARARRAIVVGAAPRVARQARERAAEAGAPVPVIVDPRPSLPKRARAYLRALRPHQWLKNLLVFLPLLATHREAGGEVLAVATTFVAFSLVASSVYCINDLLDLDADRAHPRKRNRPFASGQVPAMHGIAMAGGLFAAGFALASLVNAMTLGVLSVYFGATLLYSLALKRELVIDICLLAGLYTLRVIAGSMAVELQPSPWMLALSTFLFLSLAAMKRQTELVDLAASGRTESSGRAYRAEDLNVVTMMAIAAGYTAVLVLALYIYSPAVQRLYESPMMLWGAPPILLYWVSRMVMIAHRGGMDDDPVLFAVKDGVSIACGFGILLIGVAATVL
ncbi:UbiA family prenyltransferase [Albimonas sp. CAU 1670]|uniref:UbiA family prenyltransferase n=1 Tax=Albimonas sp. CAU 1670 TaxID=3032599 RepID=UPI0023D9B2B2|nr:UbiA family prenyltransferase [Albimonas sp. CAU 1670]MDF2234592.1 UbiA family prenyltransferase [Albimonas sp. CAU 1670]